MNGARTKLRCTAGGREIILLPMNLPGACNPEPLELGGWMWLTDAVEMEGEKWEACPLDELEDALEPEP